MKSDNSIWVIVALEEEDRVQEQTNVTPTVNHTTTDIPLYYPIFSILLMVTVWIVFLIGIYVILDTNQIGRYSPISPPEESIRYCTVSNYPYCTDCRSQPYRIFTAQFIHCGLYHIIGNTVFGLTIGILVESFHGSLFAAAIFELAVFVGTMCHAYALPYNALIGCSHGVYGWIGAAIVTAIVYTMYCYRYGRKERHLSGAILFVLLFYLVYDIFNYIYAYKPDVAYEAHAGGFITGVLCTISIFGMCNKYRDQYQHNTIFLSTTSTISIILFIILLTYHYRTNYPPAFPLVNTNYENKHPQHSCCYDKFKLLNQNNNFTQKYIVDNYYCSNLQLVPKHKYI